MATGSSLFLPQGHDHTHHLPPPFPNTCWGPQGHPQPHGFCSWLQCVKGEGDRVLAGPPRSPMPRVCMGISLTGLHTMTILSCSVHSPLRQWTGTGVLTRQNILELPGFSCPQDLWDSGTS